VAEQRGLLAEDLGAVGKLRVRMAQRELVDPLGRNVHADRLSAALDTLVRAGKIRSQRDDETGGRPRTVWHVVP
jgi:hypothetical protein